MTENAPSSEANRSRFGNNLQLAGTLLAAPFIQAAILTLGGLFTGILFLYAASSIPQDISWSLPPAGAAARLDMYMLLAGAAGALPWFGMWWMLWGISDGGRIRLFPLHLLLSWLPLVLALLWLDPQYNPEAMIPGTYGESAAMVCMALAAVLLYPFYAAAVYYGILRPKAPAARKALRLLLLCGCFAGIMLMIMPVLWRLAPRLFLGLLTFPPS